ncbi:hypothetical protein P5673_026324 [Acropora cervicornis]|uniref:Uncharacterized protein n=1 Tax=Acropora cervicornis TaxID=6130 RepID=A0AAD9Q0P5_ACRCE|nr:hypothetical protein P5673_026324 [Acropora cervicornis]
MSSLAGEVLSILVWRTVSNRERNIVRDSSWQEKRDKKMPSSTSQGGGHECIIAFLAHLPFKILVKPTRKSRLETAKGTQ